MEPMEIDQNVCKANELIQKASYDLSATEQKFLLYVISKIKPSDRSFQTYDFPMTQILDVFGIDDGGNNRAQLIASMRSLRSKTLYMQTSREEIICGWFDSVRISRGKNQTVTVRIGEDLRPYLLDLSERFTLYQLRNIMAMKSKYSIRLYELCKSHQYQGSFAIRIEDFMHITHCGNYIWRDLRSRVILPAIKEINLLTDIIVGYTPIRTGRSYTSLKFTINQKDSIQNATAGARQEILLYGL